MVRKGARVTVILVSQLLALLLFMGWHPAFVQAAPDGFVLISKGSFTMGSDMGGAFDDERPLHQVTISKDFYMSETEVTREEWFNVMGTTPWLDEYGNPREDKYGCHVDGWTGTAIGDHHPATYISWYDALEFVIAKNGGSTTGHYRLPTEAEWEYAARAGGGTDEPFSPGITAANLDDYAWYSETTVSESYPHTCGFKLPNIWGLYDMHGNVLEWCTDWFGTYSSSAQTDPTGPSSGSAKILRGGAYNDPGSALQTKDCRSTCREAFGPYTAWSDIGFRVVWTIATGSVYPEKNSSSSGGGSSSSSSSKGGGGGGGCFIRSLLP